MKKYINGSLSGRLALKGLKFHAFHGCFGFEREQGGEYEVDFEVLQEGSAQISPVARPDLLSASVSDDLDDTLDYSEIYSIISGVMSSPSNLIEKVAGSIMSDVSERYPGLGKVSVTVRKLHPPIEGIEEGYAEYTLVSLV